MRKKINILKYLSRDDKWYLGGGNRLLWAPPFPTWLQKPGFWDKAHYYNYEIEPVFTWILLDEAGQEIALEGIRRRWDPSRLIVEYRGIGGLRIRETRCCLPCDVLTSVIEVKNTGRRRRRIRCVGWTTQIHHPSKTGQYIDEVVFRGTGIAFSKHFPEGDRPAFGIGCMFGLDRKPLSYGGIISEGSVIQPFWKGTPFYEQFHGGKLPDTILNQGVTPDGLLTIALHAGINLKPGQEDGVTLFFSAAPSRAGAMTNLRRAAHYDDPVAVSERSWSEYFDSVPYFACSDEYLTRYYWYRWYGLRLLTMNGGEGNYRHPVVCEGIGYFRAPITYSAVCHMRENRWMHTPDLAQGSFLIFADNQRDDGGFRGYIDVHSYRQEMFYHANWGRAILELDALHPDRRFLAAAYDSLTRYARYFDSERDEERSGLYDIDNHYETGQEYMHRYIAVDPDADREHWGKVFRLKGVDVSVYLYELKHALAVVAGILGKGDDEVREWKAGAGRIKTAILTAMWDEKEEMFFDIDPATGRRTMVKAATCFYPYMTDIVDERHIPGLKRHVFDPGEFWTPYPVPSSSRNDPYFSALPHWKGKRMNCPWNGRVWPMTNSHIVEALAVSALRFKDPVLRRRTVEFIMKFIRMMYHDGDVRRPNAYEHYNPTTGDPSLYRGVDDYQHSWIVDLIMKYVVGFKTGGNEITVEPLPFRLRWLRADGIIAKGKLVSVNAEKGRIRLGEGGG